MYTHEQKVELVINRLNSIELVKALPHKHAARAIDMVYLGMMPEEVAMEGGVKLETVQRSLNLAVEASRV